MTAPPAQNPGRKKKKSWTMTFVRGFRKPQNMEAGSVGWGSGETDVDPLEGAALDRSRGGGWEKE